MRLRVGTAAVGLALVAAACSASGSSGSASGGNGFSIAAVASSTIAARTAHVEGTIVGTAQGEPVHGTVSGDADFAHGASSVKLRVTDETKPATLEIVVAHDTDYIRTSEAIFAGKYMELPGDLFNGSGSGAPLGMSTIGWGVADPVRALQQLRGFATRVVDVGRDTIRGIETNHLSFTVPVGALFGCLRHSTPTSDASGATYSADSVFCAAKYRGRTATIDVWADDASRMVRIETHIGLDNGLSSRLDYSQFGEHVDITAPPKSQIIDESKMVTVPGEIGKHVAVSGPWKQVTSGTTAGVAWSLASAAANDSVCVDFETSRTVPMQPSLNTPGPVVSHGIRSNVPCVNSATLFSEQVVVTATTQPGGALSAVAGVADPSVRLLTAHFDGGATAAIRIDPATDTFAWVGAPTPTFGTLTADSGHGPITCYSDPSTVFGSIPTPKPTIQVPFPVLTGFVCATNADLTMMKQHLKASPSLPSSITLTGP